MERPNRGGGTSLPQGSGEAPLPKRGFYGTLMLLLCVMLLSASAVFAEDDEALIKQGEKVYKVRCMVCHGKQGDGKGAVGVLRKSEASGRIIEIRPRDFTMGLYRFRSTATGCLPSDDDLLYIITNGIPRSFMPNLKDVPVDDLKAVRSYLKSFSSRFQEEQPCDPIVTKQPAWVGSADSVNKGKAIYKNMKCWECHGETGKGDGSKSEEIKDDWGEQILPFNFQTGDLKKGSRPQDIYMTFTSGLDGTGMPSYQDTLNEDDRWHLVSYTLKLMGKLDKNHNQSAHK
ncbi:MAG: c-type cytochrome [Nitrospirae bacterium]|uniref:c-type cytochrome n=1 Tax=Candidatus Magnetobacterium casense TaxID=1455061 RepID=UPI0005902333|nr:c-type cytochrome [Candidatus Magnetobacterium casensis]MBF0339096.1 c-type cytochrome [Nitrospirota bacterium]